jgi:hypothetical protein
MSYPPDMIGPCRVRRMECYPSSVISIKRILSSVNAAKKCTIKKKFAGVGRVSDEVSRGSRGDIFIPRAASTTI